MMINCQCISILASLVHAEWLKEGMVFGVHR
jgi:hypothetical protein